VSAAEPLPALLRDGLLDGLGIVIAHGEGRPPAHDSAARAVERLCGGQLGARVVFWALALDEDDVEAGEALTQQAFAQVEVEVDASVLLIDSAGMFAAGGRDALLGAMQATWDAARAFATRLIAKEQAGRIVLLAPTPGAGEHADAAGAGLENLARTLSIEWARHGITTVAIAPGTTTTAGELATVVGYLASPAGDYFSGCLLDLRGVPAAAASS
jgi:NAD(P)-dependent dehydrogenase (short-subunit alcohol dehydrogenase family)